MTATIPPSDAPEPDTLRKVCRSCQRTLLQGRFSNNRAVCKRCRALSARKDPATVAKRKPAELRAYVSKRAIAKRRGLVFSITEGQFKQIMDTRVCAYCGLAFTFEPGNHSRQPTLDQLVPGAGYTTDNCICLCRKCNRQKGELTADQHIRLGEWVKRAIEKRMVGG